MALEDDVIQFVADESGTEPSKLSRDTRLWEDLRIGGDDAEEFFERYQECFHVDIEELDLSLHFPWEPEAYLAGLLTSISRKIQSVPKPTYVTITVGNLITAAEKKKWAYSDARSSTPR